MWLYHATKDTTKIGPKFIMPNKSAHTSRGELGVDKMAQMKSRFQNVFNMFSTP